MNLWKKKISSISKELDLVSKKNTYLKNDLDTHVCHASIALSSNVSIACTSSSIIENDICMLKKSVDCLGFILSQCALSHSRLESMFRKKQIPSMHAHKPRHTHAPHGHTHNTLYAYVYTCTHVDVRDTLLSFVMIVYMIQI